MVTIAELEGRQWPDPGPDATGLVRRCTELSNKPIEDFTDSDLRVLLGQRIALAALLPLAVARLLDEPLLEGDYYPGDLLHAVLRLPLTDWAGAHALRAALSTRLMRADYEPDDRLASEIAAFLKQETPGE